MRSLVALTLTKLSLMLFALFKQRHVKRVCFCCYLNLTLDVFTFINTEAGLCLLLLCSFSVCLPKVDGDKTVNSFQKHIAIKEMKATLSKINQTLNIPGSISDLTLYTPENVPKKCFDTALLCFIKEMKTLEFEMDLFQKEQSTELTYIKRMKTYQRILHEVSNCKPCEEFQEKNVTSFLNSFISLLQQIHKLNP